MLKHTITVKQIQYLITTFWLGTMIIAGYNQTLKQDSWAGILLSSTLFLPILLLYARIIRLFPSQDLFSIMIKVFGSLWGKILSASMTLYAIYLGALVLKNTTQFITDLNLTSTPGEVIFIILSLLALWALIHGPENLARLSKFILPILLFTIVFTCVIGFRDMDFNNIKPVLHTDYKILLSQSMIFLTVPLGESIICLPFFGAVSSLVNPLKVFLKALAITTGIAVLASLRDVLILGTGTANMYYYPSYQTITIIALGDFFTRIEVLVGLSLMMACFIKFASCVYISSLGLTKIMEFPNPKHAIVQCLLVTITLSSMVYSNTIEMLNFIPYYPYIAVIFQIFLPLAILIGAEIKMRKKSPKSPGPSEIKASQQSPSPIPNEAAD